MLVKACVQDTGDGSIDHLSARCRPCARPVTFARNDHSLDTHLPSISVVNSLNGMDKRLTTPGGATDQEETLHSPDER